MTTAHHTAREPSSAVRVRIRFFARYAEVLGRTDASLRLEAPATVADAVKALREQIPGAEALPERPLVALNCEHVLYDRPIGDGDELALLPPLAGG